MKHLLYILPLCILMSCSDTPTSDKKLADKNTKPTGPHQARPQIPMVVNYDSLDSSVRNQVQALDSIYGKTPYYTTLDNKKVFIVMKGAFNKNYYEEQFNGRYKYGIVDDSLKPILNCEYDKIYNPNLTVMDCMEIKIGKEVGLYNFVTSEILLPQFEFIVPSSQIPDNIAYGFKTGVWYKIENGKNIKVSKTDFSPVESFKNISFDGQSLKGNYFHLTYDFEDFEGQDKLVVVVTPSYLEYFNIMPEICEDFILKDDKDTGHGTTELTIHTDTTKSITDKIISFVVSFYSAGIDARDYAQTSKQVVVYHKEKEMFDKKILSKDYHNNGYFCQTDGYKFINDTLIEVMSSRVTDTSVTMERRYDSENTYTYKLITKDGTVQDLRSNRYYNFTKYSVINESYFKGCYSRWREDSEKSDDDYNMWVSEHLTIDDLDLMINEIYAEYGLKFKTEKWKTYFSQYNWYKPQFDNVDKLLSPVDKKNIEIIAKEKAKMKGKESDFVKKRKETHYAAG